MTNFHEQAAADAIEILGEVGRRVVFRGAERLVMIADQVMGLDLNTGGFASSGAITVRFLAAQFGDQPPKDAEHLVHAGETYRISSVSRRLPSQWVECRCEPLNQR